MPITSGSRARPGARICCSSCAPFGAACPPISNSTGTGRMPGSFFDTNVLLHLASGDTAKADRAQAAIADGGAISVQVLNEITNVARRKMRMSWADTHIFLSALRGLLTVHPVSLEMH